MNLYGTTFTGRDGNRYAGHVIAPTWEAAEELAQQRNETEHVDGVVCEIGELTPDGPLTLYSTEG